MDVGSALSVEPGRTVALTSIGISVPARDGGKVRSGPRLLATEEPRLATSEHDLLSRDERHLDVRIDVTLHWIVDISHPSVGLCQTHVAKKRKAYDRPVAQGGVFVPGVVEGLTL